MYTCYLLTDKSRNQLLEKFPPKYPNVICHHITVKYPAPADAPLPEAPSSVTVIGYIDDHKGLETLLVSVDGDTKRPDGKVFHITHSLNSMLGYKPVDSNTLIKESKNIVPVDPFTIEVTPSLQG
jgi:hypothetical protein